MSRIEVVVIVDVIVVVAADSELASVVVAIDRPKVVGYPDLALQA